jgi:hypothetical protein
MVEAPGDPEAAELAALAVPELTGTEIPGSMEKKVAEIEVPGTPGDMAPVVAPTPEAEGLETAELTTQGVVAAPEIEEPVAPGATD